MHALLLWALLAAAPPAETGTPETAAPVGAAESSRGPELGESAQARRARTRPARRAAFRGYLERPVPRSARFLDHGVLEVAMGGGSPHLYRLEARLGVLDHLSLGVQTHWLPSQDVPQLGPTASFAFWRGPMLEVGAHYDSSLHPPPPGDDDPETPEYPRRTHWVFGTLGVYLRPVSAGVDLGVAHLRQPASPDPGADETLFVRRVVAAGGIHLRFGNRRFGFTAQARAAAAAAFTEIYAEGRFDLRFGLFERRARGGWRNW